MSQTAAIRRFREKEYIRYMELARHQAVDQRVADEKQDEYEGAKAAEEKAHASVKAAEAELTRARAQVLTAKANLEHALAEQRVAEARLGQATILAQYTRILSPYTGVVTQRATFHDGDFIREAIRGDEVPILSVARTDLMRVVIYVPDRDTPFLNRGDEAVIRIDALGGEEFKGKVMRYSEIESRDSFPGWFRGPGCCARCAAVRQERLSRRRRQCGPAALAGLANGARRPRRPCGLLLVLLRSAAHATSGALSSLSPYRRSPLPIPVPGFPGLSSGITSPGRLGGCYRLPSRSGVPALDTARDRERERPDVRVCGLRA